MISPVSVMFPSGATIFHDDPAVHWLSQRTPNQYCFMNCASSVSAAALNLEGREGWQLKQIILPSSSWGTSDSMVAVLERLGAPPSS
jgi:uncharacterized protein DUF4177